MDAAAQSIQATTSILVQNGLPGGVHPG